MGISHEALGRERDLVLPMTIIYLQNHPPDHNVLPHSQRRITRRNSPAFVFLNTSVD